MNFTESDAAMAPGIDAVNEHATVDNLVMPADAQMAPEPIAKTDVPNWTNLKNFQVFSVSGGHTLYANGYQQLKLIVLVQAENSGGVVVDISAAELEGVQLFDAQSGKALVVDNIREGEPLAWKCLLQPRPSFEAFPYPGEPQGPVTRGKGIALKEFYVSSNSPASIKLIAAITRSDGQAFYSEEGKEFGDVSLKTIPPAIYRKELYRLRHVSSHTPATEHVAKVDRYVLDLLLDQHQIKFVECNVVGLLHARSEHPDYLGYYAVAYFNGHKAHHSQGVPWDTVDGVAMSNEEPGKVTLLMHYAKKGGRSQIRSDHWEMRLFLQDMYGNKHDVDVRVTPTFPPMIQII